jgi:hypothetical protein
MNITNQELLMLEQLCYVNGALCEAANIDKIDITRNEDNSIETILSVFNETAISNLEALGDAEVDGACASGKEWAQIITYLKNSDNLKDLVLTETLTNDKGTPLALCFTDEIRN